MKLINQILEKVVCGEDFTVAGGESVVSSKLSKVIAGVPVYSLTIQRNVDFAPDITAETFDELMQKGGEYLRICPECDGIPEMGYFIDQEDNLKLCSVECVRNHLNWKYGKDNWKEKENGDGTPEYWVKIPESSDEIYDECVKELDGYWRRYGLVYVKPFYLKNDAEQLDFITDLFD